MFKQNLIIIMALASPVLCLSGCNSHSGLSAPGRWLAEKNRKREAKSDDEARKRAELTLQSTNNPYGRKNTAVKSQVIRLMEKQRFAQALKILDKQIVAHKNSAQAQSLRGDCLYQLLKFKEAIAAYLVARKIDKLYYPALRGLGFVYLNLAKKYSRENNLQDSFTNYRKSLEILRDACKKLPNDVRAAYGLAFAAQGVAEYFHQRAISLLRVRSDMQGAETMRERSVGFYREAIKATRSYVLINNAEIEPRVLMARIFTHLAMLYKEFRQLGQARNSMGNALISWQSILKDIDSDNSQAKTEAARCSKLLQVWNTRVNSRQGAEVFE